MVDEQAVRRVAETARLALTDEEVARFGRELNEILEAFAVLEKAPVQGLEPAYHPIDVRDATRKDEVEPSLPRDKALANAILKEDGYFKGPRVV